MLGLGFKVNAVGASFFPSIRRLGKSAVLFAGTLGTISVVRVLDVVSLPLLWPTFMSISQNSHVQVNKGFSNIS